MRSMICADVKIV